MGCLFAIFAGVFPRIADILLWLARPAQFTAPFGGAWLWPLLGILFLPLTTLFYVFMWSPTRGLEGFDWVWIFLAVALDLSHLAGTASPTRARVRGSAPAGAPPRTI